MFLFHIVVRLSVQLAWVHRWASMISIAVQDAIRASLLAPFGVRLVLEPSAAFVPELDSLLDGQRWAFD